MNAINSIFGALKYVPATVARKALEKVNPKFGNYFSSALAYGVDANRALDFLMDRFESSAQRTHKEELEKGAAQGTLRPDEMASRSQMQNAALPGKILKGAASIGAGGLAGALPDVAVQSQQQEQMPEHIPGLGQYKAEHVPGLGQYKGEHVPGLGQLKAPHGPKEISAREKGLKRHAEMTKKKKLIDQLNQEFENEYGQGNVSPSGLSSSSKGFNANERIQQGTPGNQKSELIQALMEVKKILQ